MLMNHNDVWNKCSNFLNAILVELHIYITKSGKRHRMSDSTLSFPGYAPITANNRKPGEISFFTGYTSETEVPDGTKWMGTRTRFVNIP